MPRLQHFDHDGRVRFVTFSTYRRVPVLSNAAFRDRVVETIGTVRAKYWFKLLAYVVMPEHVLMVLWPPEALKLAPIVGQIKRESSYKIHAMLDAGGMMARRLVHLQKGVPAFQLWQLRGYDHNCRTEQSVWEKVNYCHWNPVKPGLVKHPEDWAWSSYRSYEGIAASLLTVDALIEWPTEQIHVRGICEQ
jgi:putative transposase